jgi:TetR/AcrR family transcriptional regulator
VIFREASGRLLPGIRRIFESEDMDFFGKIRAFCRMYIQMGIDHPYLPIFVLHEMHTGSGGPFKKILSAFKNKPLQAVVLSVNEAIKTKTIRPVDPLQLILNIFSLCIFPVVAKPMFQHVSGLTDDQLDKLLAARVDEVSAFIINAIRYTK